jgi:hypothetical protein
MHTAKGQFAMFKKRVVSWSPEPGVVDVRPADQRVTISERGIQGSAIAYISKQMTPQASYKRWLRRQKGGAILGKRGGVTRNIGSAAIDSYFNEQRAQRALHYHVEAPSLSADLADPPVSAKLAA